MKAFRFLLCIVLVGTAWPLAAGQANSLPDAPAPALTVSNADGVTTAYTRPTREQKLSNYWNEAFGPYPMGSTVVVAAWHQAWRTPPDWREGWAGYGERYASDFGTSAINVSTRYALAKVMDEDTLYYRCSCKGIAPRLEHAAVTTLFVHQGADGHRAFALPVIVAPYAANMTAVYAWYPRRYGAKDAFRMGNYGLLWYFAGNVSLEFLSPLTHRKHGTSWMTRWHLDNRHLAPESEP